MLAQTGAEYILADHYDSNGPTFGDDRAGSMTAASTFIQRIERVYRAIGTGSVFVWFGLGAVVISATIFPFLRAISPDADAARRRIQRAMQKTLRIYMELMRRPKLMT